MPVPVLLLLVLVAAVPHYAALGPSPSHLLQVCRTNQSGPLCTTKRVFSCASVPGTGTRAPGGS
eukprot:1413653-Rhodomonas_salina.2